MGSKKKYASLQRGKRGKDPREGKKGLVQRLHSRKGKGGESPYELMSVLLKEKEGLGRNEKGRSLEPRRRGKGHVGGGAWAFSWKVVSYWKAGKVCDGGKENGTQEKRRDDP